MSKTICTFDEELILSVIEYLEKKGNITNIELNIYKTFKNIDKNKPNGVQRGCNLYKVALSDNEFTLVEEIAKKVYDYATIQLLDNYMFPEDLTKTIIHHMKKIKKRTQDEESILEAFEEALLSSKIVDGIKINDVMLSEDEEKYVYKLLIKIGIITGKDADGNYMYNDMAIIYDDGIIALNKIYEELKKEHEEWMTWIYK